MRIQLINPIREDWSTYHQILYNRGFTDDDIKVYQNLSFDNVNSPLLLGEKNLKAGAKALISCVQNNESAIVLVDCDCDGYTSGALIINYLHKVFPAWVENHLNWSLHEGKIHGLKDQMEKFTQNNYKLIICPDSSSNDYEYHKELKKNGSTVLILDHHPTDNNKISEDAITINNQLSSYPNKDLSGVGIAWQFCRYLDNLLNLNYANDFLDLVAIGNCGDMMSLKSFETKFLIQEGLKIKNIHNPLIEYLIDKNGFSLSKAAYKSSFSEQACTSIGAAFFIIPFINAMTRSGTTEEKEMIFESMLNHLAFEKIPEIKYNKLTGDTEPRVLQACRVITNVKKRQTKAEEAGLAFLEKEIKEKDMMKNKMLLFLLDKDEIPSEIRGLVANKLMAKYQRPCAILSRVEEIVPIYKDEIQATRIVTVTYEGSMRGYTKNGLVSFKELLNQCPGVKYVQGHDNAAGLSLYAYRIDEFKAEVERLLSAYPSEPLYRVDYYFDHLNDKNAERILNIGTMNDLWGQDVERSYIAIKFKITESNFKLMKSNTGKIDLTNGVSIIKFKCTDEDIENFTTTGWKEIEAYCSCGINEWNGHVSPQLILEDYKILDSCKYLF